MWWRLLLGILVAGLVAAPAAEARPPCGPAGATTLARGGDARVYVAGARVVGCHRGTSRRLRLGARRGVRRALVAGRYAAVVHRRAAGEKIVLYDARRARWVADTSSLSLRRITRLRLDPVGIAAYVAVRSRGDATVGTVGDYNTDTLAYGDGIDLRTLGFAGSTVAWRRGPNVEFVAVYVDEGDPAPGRLLRLDGLDLTAADGEMYLRPDGRSRLSLGRACALNGCSGIDALQRAGRFVLVRTVSYDRDRAYAGLDLVDVVERTKVEIYGTPENTSVDLGSFVVTEGGATVFAVEEDPLWPPERLGVRRIATGDGRVLDEGRGIDIDSLRRRGARVVWLNAGVERSAPIEP